MAEARPDRILSRYSEVSAALRDPNLLIVGSRPESQPEAGPARVEIQAGLPAERIAEWQERLETLARQIFSLLPSDRPVDLIAEFARPWGKTAAELVTGVAAADRLTQLAAEVSSATADPYDADLRARAAAASSAMNAFFPGRIPPNDASTFVALSQTLVHLLANCWLPLVERPDEIERLAANLDWMPRAVEEMLRVAGVPRMVFRRAATGERLTLMLAAANRDPEQFPDPDRLDISRAPAGQLSLGGWLHSCVGGPLIRMAIGVATAAWVARFATAEESAPVEWLGGPILRWPSALLIRLKST